MALLAEAAAHTDEGMSGVIRLALTPSMSYHGGEPTSRTNAGQPFQVGIPGSAIVAQRPSSWDNYNHAGAKARSSHPAKDCSLGTFAPSYQILLKKNHIACQKAFFQDWPVNKSRRYAQILSPIFSHLQALRPRTSSASCYPPIG